MRVKDIIFAVGVGLGLVGVLAAISGCSRSQDSDYFQGASPAHLPRVTGGDPEGDRATLSNGAKINLQLHGGMRYLEQEGAFSSDVFEKMLSATAHLPESERSSAISREIDKVFVAFKRASAVEIKRVPMVGYFKFRMPYQRGDFMAPLRELKLRGMTISPVVYDGDALKQAKAFRPSAEGFELRPSFRAGRAGAKDFSGLERMNATEFVKQAEADIGGGVRVDGSGVRLGITDTGITYNHPTFLSKDRSRNRIIYMKDFTREGRVYFNPQAKFSVSLPSGGGTEDLIVDAQVIVTPTRPTEPAADEFTELTAVTIKVTPELKAILTQPGSGGAKLGILLESSFANPSGEVVDLNGNGKIDDHLYVLFVPGKTPAEDVVYLDLSASGGDFRFSPALGDWNTTGKTISAFAEKFGLSFEADSLASKDGKTQVPVRSVSVVGFDPGNHGSHVAGIAAGSKTIANDRDDTLARGVAPEAQILLNRVCSNNGGCNAMEAFIDLATVAGVDVINMSLGGLNPFNDGFGLEEMMINRLTSLKNTLFVVSAGNNGPGRQTVGSPSVARLSLSVGATATPGMIQRQYQWPGMGSALSQDAAADYMLFFSSRGPTAAGGFKPSISAPGTELSSIQLNSAPGSRGGLDVYWGTSMAAPAATGAYALFLDAVRKYNLRHPSELLPTDAITLRRVLIESARPFDVAKLDVETGQKTTGQYTWADQGAGMVDLLNAWKKLFEVRNTAIASAVRATKDVELDYEVIVSQKNPNGVAYDGTRGSEKVGPSFGTGIYLNYFENETLVPVYVARKLPEAWVGSPEAGELTRQLLTTRDEFVLKTVIYGSDQVWLKAGVLDQLDCWSSDTAPASIIGRGVDLKVNDDGTAEIAPFNASTLNVCLNREMIQKSLSPGDHGAIISAYRVVDGQISPVASFVVPVFITVPHRTLKDSTAYQVESSVKSFGVNRNYVTIPKGTTLVQVVLEVPPLKAGEGCSGVELMALMGDNQSKPFKTRKEARASNCDPNGKPLEAENFRRVVFVKSNPNPGTWDLHVFGVYKYLQSRYKLRVDYITASSSIAKISGNLASLNGSYEWSMKDGSFDVVPDAQASTFEIRGLFNEVESSVDKGKFVLVESPLGVYRSYPAGVKKVTITTSGSPGNDIDLTIFECEPVLTGKPTECNPVATSGGSTDEESASFIPRSGRLYAARVDGYAIKDEGRFKSGEMLEFETDYGELVLSGEASRLNVKYSFSPEKVKASPVLSHSLFAPQKYDAVGAVVLRTSVGIPLSTVPVRIWAGQ